MSNWRFSFLVAFHELIEMALCRHNGVTASDVDNFDMAFEARRESGNTLEPGDDPTSPYFWQHQLATMFERVMARLLDVDWDDYANAIDAL
jgi:hypothetical protein